MTIDELRRALALAREKPTKREIERGKVFTRRIIKEERELFEMLRKL
jgi:hypothetical protein